MLLALRPPDRGERTRCVQLEAHPQASDHAYGKVDRLDQNAWGGGPASKLSRWLPSDSEATGSRFAEQVSSPRLVHTSFANDPI